MKIIKYLMVKLFSHIPRVSSFLEIILTPEFILIVMLGVSNISYANYSKITESGEYVVIEEDKNAVHERIKKEKQGIYAISLYKPSYFLPVYYSTRPDTAIYLNNTPNNQSIQPFDAKLQFSFKVPVWQNIFSDASDLYLAYTQFSYWQAYNHSAFFRETDYEPEIYLANNIDGPFLPGWKFNFLNLGLAHQSNGKGAKLERAWERAYLEAILSNENWMVSLKPWYPIREATARHYNPDIAKYLGYGRLLVSYKHNDQVFSLEVRNAAESRFKRGAIQADWSLPLTKHISGYMQIFSGYGQSLIEYNHYTNAVGIGIALNRWI